MKPKPHRKPKARGQDEDAWRLWDSVPDVVYRVRGPDGVIESLSAAFERLTGWALSKWVGRPFGDLIHPDDLSRAIETYEASRRGETRAPYDLRIRTKAGGYIVGEFHGAPLVEAGRVVGECGIARDVTDRKHAERVQHAVYRVAEAAVTAPTLPVLFTAIHWVVGELMPAKNLYIALYDAASDTLAFPYSVDEFDAVRAPRKPRGGLTEYVLRTGQPVLASPEVFADLERRGEIVLSGTRAVDWLGVPLKTGEQTIGVLAVQSYTEGVRYSADDQRLLQFVSAPIAMAIERRRAVEALRESGERYRGLFEHMQEGLVYARMLFVDGRPWDYEYLAANAAFERLTGLKNVVGRKVSEVMPGIRETDPELLEVYGRVASGGAPERFEIYVHALKHWFSVSVFAPQVGYFVAVLDRITERKQAEAELRRLNRLYRVLSRANQMILRARDSQRVFGEACRIAVEDAGFRMAWVGVVDDATHFVKPVAMSGDVGTYLGGIRISVDEIPEGGGPTGTALREGKHFVCRDIEHESSMAPWRDAALAMGYRSSAAFPLRTSGMVTGVYTVYSSEVGGLADAEVQVLDELADDISYALEHLEGERLRERAEKALQQSEARYRSLVEHAVYGIYRSTLEGQFVAANPALVEMLGYDAEEELLARDMARDIYADPGERQRLIEQYHDAERIDGVDVVWKRKDGTPIVVRLSGRPVRRADGSVEGFGMLVEDVTERRRLEEQLRQAQKMEAVGQLAGGVAHDFNNLLTAVIASCDLLGAELPADSQYAEDLKTICTAAEHGAELTKKLLAFSRRQPLELRKVSLATVANDFLPMARRVVSEDVELAVRVDAPETTARADAGAIEQILMNLVTNARDATPAGGRILIEVGRRALDDEHRRIHGWGRPGEYVTLSVSDTGSGMDAATQRRVFEPFFTTKPVGQGTGLGMSMVYGLVKQQEGFVHVYSEVGHGTTVRVYLPVVAGPGKQLAGPAPPELRGGSETVLLVEDDASVRSAATRVLEKFGYTVLTAVDGYDALEILEKRAAPPDLIVSDVVMPRVSGPHLVSKLREAGPVPKLLFTSGYTARDVVERAQLDPGLPFLAKPWTVTDLIRKVREVLDSGGPS